MAAAFTRKGSIFALLAFAFLMGFSTTVAELALIAFACLFPIMAVLAYASLADRITRRKLASGKTRR